MHVQCTVKVMLQRVCVQYEKFFLGLFVVLGDSTVFVYCCCCCDRRRRPTLIYMVTLILMAEEDYQDQKGMRRCLSSPRSMFYCFSL